MGTLQKTIMQKIIVTIILFSLPLVTHASGIQVSPSKLEFNISQKAETKKVIVVNPTVDVQIFKVYLDDSTRGVELSPASFTLEAGGRKEVAITVDPKKFSSPDTIVYTALSVLGSPLMEGSVPVGTGVKVQVSVTRSGGSSVNVTGLIFGLVAVVLLGGVWAWKWRRSRSQGL